jgi:diacylglycerol kinase (ATP)
MRDVRVTAVVNPTKLDPASGGIGEARSRLRMLLARHGATLVWTETTRDDPGTGQAREALRAGTDLVLAWGGDGTVTAVATAMAAQDSAGRVPMAILPGGTGNLLARNLGLPLRMEDAVAVAATGTDRAIDVLDVGLGGRVVLGTVIAGIGADAELVDASEGLKRRLGPMAYVANATRAARSPRMRVGVSVDGSKPRWSRARSVLVANVGGLVGGLNVAPEARPDDGWLDVVLLSLSSPRDWAVAAASLVRRTAAADRGRTHLRGRRVTVVTRGEHPRQVDGDQVGPGTRLEARVRPGALLVRVPA